MAGKGTVVAGDAAVIVDKIQPPTICLFANRGLSGRAMCLHFLAGRQGGNRDAAMDDGAGSHGDAVVWRACSVSVLAIPENKESSRRKRQPSTPSI